MLNGWEVVLIFMILLVLFGAKKLPDLAKGLGHGLREFKKATRDITEDLQSSLEETPSRPAPPSLQWNQPANTVQASGSEPYETESHPEPDEMPKETPSTSETETEVSHARDYQADKQS